MEFFNNYTSNTYAGTCNQHCFFGQKDEVHTGRIFYKISHGGTYNYAFLFSNMTDSTFSNGDISHRNTICDPWTIYEMRVGRCNGTVFGLEFKEQGNEINEQTYDWKPVTFNGQTRKDVAPGEFFNTDAVELTFETDDYLCLEITFSGTKIPYMEEIQIPVYRYRDGGWVYHKWMPCPSMVGCDRKVKARIGYLGDSITQGIGPELNSYGHWNAQLSRKLGPEYSYWNLGIGCARANDIATDSAWLYKAKHNDVVFLCCGTNDTWRGYPEKQIVQDIESIVDILNKEGITVILQTIPPFNYNEKHVERWKWMNEHIRTVLKDKVALVFDEGPCLRESEERSHYDKYGAHPNAEGCAIWAEELYKAIKEAKTL